MMINFIRNLVDEGNLIFDVGANIGQKADLYLASGAKVVCFEPQPHCVEILQQKYQNNQNLTIVNKGLADQTGKMQLSVCSHANYLSTFSDKWKTGRFADQNWSETVTVEVTTLDKMIQQWGVPQFCKIDVEGFEYQVLKGLSRPVPYISFEFTQEFIEDAKKCINYLQTLGYRLFNFARGEEANFAIPEWVSAEGLFHAIESTNEPLLWGDIYAKYEVEKVTAQQTLSPPGTKEIELSGEVAVIQKYITNHQIVFDVGANLGDWTQEVLKKHPDLEVHLFEPIPQVYKTLLQNLAEPIQQGNVIPLNFALGEKEEVKTFYNYEELPVLSTFHRRLEVEKQGLSTPKEFTVLTTTLDSYCQRQGLKRINFLKIDVEGGELNVLYGAKQLLKTGGIDYIQFEYGGTYLDSQATLKEAFEYLQKFHYSLFKIGPNGLEYKPTFLATDENFEYSNYLAVNERFRSNVLGEVQQGMLDLQQLCRQHSLTPRGVIHVGAHEGTELKAYQDLGVQKVLFIEANPVVFERLQANIAETPNVQAANFAISNQNGTVKLHVTSFDQSSSILPLKQHQEIYPQIQETHQVTVPSRTLDALLQELGLDPSDFNLLNIDIQGAELLALQGATNWLKYVDAINTEVNYEELYEGCALIHQLDEFLEKYGFERVATTTPHHPTWGDALYVKKPVITLSTLGLDRVARLGNNIFQYAFLKIYALENNLRVETPAWIGQYLFGHNDPPISKALPAIGEQAQPYKLSDSAILNAPEPLKNVDFHGYFQFHTQYHARHQDYFRSLFQPVPAVEAKVAEALNRLRSQGKTIVGLHLRRGDYQSISSVVPYLAVAPSEWYKEWLNGFWETLEEPVLFIASDEIESVINDFADYHPVTVKDLGVELPEAPCYLDFYILSQCDVLAISNSTFSFAASMLNERCKFCFRPNLQKQKLIAYDPWNSEPLLRDTPTPIPATKAQSSVNFVTIQEVRLIPAEAPDLVWGATIDSPVIETQVNASNIWIGGWVLGKKCPATQVEFLNEGEVVRKIPIDHPRPDVARAYPAVPSGETCGYGTLWELTGTSSETEILIQAVLADETRVKIGVVRWKETSSQTSSNHRRSKCELSVGAIMKDEAPYLIEWLEFHKIVGVERFYLYNNNSTDSTKELLQPYVQSGEVVLLDWPVTPGQKSAYEHCLRAYKTESEWIAFIDLDEFLFPTEKEDLKEVLKEFEGVAGVGANMLYFGSSGHKVRPEGLQIEQFTKRSADTFDMNKYVKSIVRPQQVLGPSCPHFFIPINEEAALVTENQERLTSSIAERVSVQKLRINHYYTRSKQEIKEKVMRGDAFFPWQKALTVLESMDRNDVEDLTIQRFVPQLRQAVDAAISQSPIAQVLKEKWSLQSKLYLMQAEVEESQVGQHQLQEQLQQSQAQLHQAQQELKHLQFQHQQAVAELLQSKSQLGECQVKLQQFQSVAAQLNQLAEYYGGQNKLNDAPTCKNWGNIFQALGQLEEAKRWYHQALEIQPNFAPALANLGTLYAQQQQWFEAIAYYQKAIAIEPSSGFYRNLAKLFAQIGKPEEATECSYTALTLAPTANAEEYVNLGNTLSKQGKQERAAICYHRALYLNPNLGTAYQQLGELLMAQGQWSEGIAHYRKATKLQPNNAEIHQKLADFLQEKGLWDEAFTLYHRAIALKPDSFWAHYNLAQTLLKLEKWELAVASYRRAAEINPTFPWCYYSLGDALLKLGKIQEAADAYRRSAELNPDFFGAHHNLGDALLQLEEWEEAAIAYRRASELNPNFFWSHYNLAQMLFKLERWEEAVPAYRRANELDPNFTWSYNSLGDALIQLERWEEAIVAYRRALELNPDLPWCYYHIAEASLKLERWEDAVAAYRRGIELAADLPWSYHTLGDAFLKLGQQQEAISTYRLATENNPEDAEVYYNFGESLAKAGQLEEAISAYRRAIELSSRT